MKLTAMAVCAALSFAAVSCNGDAKNEEKKDTPAAASTPAPAPAEKKDSPMEMKKDSPTAAGTGNERKPVGKPTISTQQTAPASAH